MTTRIPEQKAAYTFGIVFVAGILVIALFVREPSPFQYFAFRVVLALAVAGVAAMIPGFLEVEVKPVIRAAGAIAVFVIVYFFSPAELVLRSSRESATSPGITGSSPAQPSAGSSSLDQKRNEPKSNDDSRQLLTYAWSRLRTVYHYSRCCWVRRIKDENLQTSNDQPAKNLHQGCPTREGTDGCIN